MVTRLKTEWPQTAKYCTHLQNVELEISEITAKTLLL